MSEIDFFRYFVKDVFDAKLNIPQNSLGKFILLCKSLAFAAKFETVMELSSILMAFVCKKVAFCCRTCGRSWATTSQIPLLPG